MSRAFAGIGTLLAALGVLGFVSNPLFGVISAGPIHNLVRLTTGILALTASRQGIGAMRNWGKGLGCFYLALALLGLASGADLPGGLRLVRPDNLLHLGAAAFFLYYALLAPPRR